MRLALFSILVFGLLLFGCAQQGQKQVPLATASPSVMAAASAMPTAEMNKEYFKIERPSGEIKGPHVNVKLSSTMYKIGKVGGPNAEGEGHFHFFLDGGDYIPVASWEYLLKNVKPGKHSLKVQLMQNDHSPRMMNGAVDPASVKEVSFVVLPGQFSIDSPESGATVSGPNVTVKLSSTMYKIGKVGGADMAGEGHFHFYVDGGDYIPVASWDYVVANLPEGEHTVKVQLMQNDHSPRMVNGVLDPESVMQVTFMVKKPQLFVIEAPMGEVEGPNVTVKLSSELYKIGKVGGADVAGEGHFHFFLDGGDYIPVASWTYVLANLKPGKHTLKVQLMQNDHSPRMVNGKVDPDSVKEMKFTVKAVKYFMIDSPKEGESYAEGNLTVKLSSKLYKIGAVGGAVMAGEGHFHFFVDGGDYIPVASWEHVLSGLKPGKHTLKVQLMQNDHSPRMDYGAVEPSSVIEVSFMISPSGPFSIDSPASGASVAGPDVLVKLSSASYKIGKVGGAGMAGEGHFHFFVDGGDYIPVAAWEYVLKNLAAGEHTLKVQLMQNDHSPRMVNGAVEGASVKEVKFKLLTGAAASVAASVSATVAASASVAAATVKEFTLTAKQFEFSPSTITVKKGDKVRLKVTAMDTVHGFSLPDFNTEGQLNPGKETVFEFTADKAGDFTWRCSLYCGNGHGQMSGHLIVEG